MSDGAFWDDLNENLQDPEFRAEFERVSAELGSAPLEPTALAYTPDHLMPTEPMPQAWIEALERDEDTYLLALQSVDRWGRRYRLSPAMRLRAIRAVVEAALSDQSV